jgi:hypothetical protein
MPGDLKTLGNWIITLVPLFFKAIAKKTIELGAGLKFSALMWLKKNKTDTSKNLE